MVKRKPSSGRAREGYVSGALRKLGEFSSNLYRSGIDSLGKGYRAIAEKVEDSPGYKVAIASVPLAAATLGASYLIEDPVTSEMLNYVASGSLGAGIASLAEEYFGSQARMTEQKQRENEMRRLKEEMRTYRKQFTEQLKIVRTLKRLVRELLKEERKQTEILEGELVVTQGA